MLRRLIAVALTPVARRREGVLSPRRKARTVIEYGRRHGAGTLVETGTYRGGTVAACRGAFRRIYTIELDPALHARAARRFSGDPTVTLIQGDSCEELLELAPTIEGPALFWLDAHHSAGRTAQGPHDPPLEWELRAVLDRDEPDIVLVDDARLMERDSRWPTVDEVREIVGERAASFEVRDDIVRIVLRKSEPAAA